MKTTKSNYRVEVRYDPWPSSAPPHEHMLAAGAEIMTEVQEKLGIGRSDISLAWDVSHQCENCETKLDLVGDEYECIHCEQMMCLFCNCNTDDMPICEDCWEGGKR